MVSFTTIPSPLGELTLAGDGEALCGLWLPKQKYFGGRVLSQAVREDGLPVFDATRRWLERYFRGERPSPGELPLRPVGSEFQRTVWKLLLEIPYGQVTTYGSIAARMAAAMNGAMSGQAVGGAVGHNPISIVIPCHRVVGSHGSLTGYAGGIAVKVRLLTLEGADISGYKIPKDTVRRRGGLREL